MTRRIVSVIETVLLTLAALAILALLVGKLSADGRGSQPDSRAGVSWMGLEEDWAAVQGVAPTYQQDPARRETPDTGSQAVDTVMVAGWATWYDDGPGLYGAVPGWDHHRYQARVCLDAKLHIDSCVTVTVRDTCACGQRSGRDTVIDLSPAAFRRLAPLSIGVIAVTVEWPIDEEVIPLPPTDTAP